MQNAPPMPRETKVSDQVVKIARAVNNTMNFNSLPTDNVENKVGFNHQDTVTGLPKLGMSRHPSQERMSFKLTNAFIKMINKANSPAWAILCDELQDRNEILLGSRKVSEDSFTGH